MNMRCFKNRGLIISGMLLVLVTVVLSSCDRTPSPEGRMEIKVENLQKEMMDSLQQQNRAILDSIGKMREEIEELKQLKN